MTNQRGRSQKIATPDQPTISVVLPTYNRAATVRRAISSVLNQTYKKFELIVIDDGSNDQTQTILGEIQDSRVQIIHQPQNSGAAIARNQGILQAKADWVAFQDSDDAWMSDKLRRQVAVIEKASPRLGVVYCNYQRVHRKVNKIGIPPLRVFTSKLGLLNLRLEGDLGYALARGNFITTQSAVVRKSCLEEVDGFDTKLKRLQDWDLWLRIADQHEFAYINTPLVSLYLSPSRISANNDSLLNAFQRILAKHSHNDDLYRLLLAQYHFAQADLAFHSNNQAYGRKQITRSLQLDPTNTAYWFSTLAAYLGPSFYGRWVRFAGLSYDQQSDETSS